MTILKVNESSKKPQLYITIHDISKRSVVSGRGKYFGGKQVYKLCGIINLYKFWETNCSLYDKYDLLDYSLFN